MQCGSPQSGIIFFMIFQLIVPLMFLDLFVAIILEGFEAMSKNVNVIISEGELEKFRDCWAEYDNNVSFSPDILILLIGHWIYLDPRSSQIFA